MGITNGTVGRMEFIEAGGAVLGGRMAAMTEILIAARTVEIMMGRARIEVTKGGLGGGVATGMEII